MRDLSKIGESPVDMSHRLETRGWLGNNGKRVSLCLGASAFATDCLWVELVSCIILCVVRKHVSE